MCRLSPKGRGSYIGHTHPQAEMDMKLPIRWQHCFVCQIRRKPGHVFSVDCIIVVTESSSWIPRSNSLVISPHTGHTFERNEAKLGFDRLSMPWVKIFILCDRLQPQPLVSCMLRDFHLCFQTLLNNALNNALTPRIGETM